MASLIETHNALPLAHLAPLLPPTLLRTQLYTSASIPPRLFTECFNLVRDNMMEMYKRTVGWKAGDKRKEMKHPAMRYLLALGDSNGVADGNEWEDEDDEGACSVLAYVSFMVTEEEGDEVVYCYEVHVSEHEQGKGIGAELMRMVEVFGKNVGLAKIMLTVFSENEGALRFYRRIGFEKDEISPLPRISLRSGEVREPKYYIFSKEL